MLSNIRTEILSGSSSSKQVYDESGIFILTNGYLTEGRKNAKNIQVAERNVLVSWVGNAYIIANCYLLSVISKDNVVTR